MSEHTPTPWHRNIPPAAKYNTIWSGRNKHVLHLATSGIDAAEVEANAEFIVRACNAHEALILALEAARATLVMEGYVSSADQPSYALMARIDEALALAKDGVSNAR